MSHYYPNGQTPANSFAPPSPTNYDISLIVEPAPNGTSGLYLGNITAATNNTMLKALNIKSMLTSAVEANFTPDPSVTPNYLKIAALDHPDYPIEQHFEEAAQFIHQSLAVSNVLVHCMAGVSRSVSFVLAYLMKYRRMKLDDAYNVVLNNRTIINPNIGFRKQLKNYESKVKELWKSEDKKMKKMQKMMKQHHPALMFAQQPSTYSEENNELVISRKSLPKDRPPTGRELLQSSPSVLRASTVSNGGQTVSLSASIPNPKILTSQNFYFSKQAPRNNITPTKSERTIPSQGQIPAPSLVSSQGQPSNSNSLLSLPSSMQNSLRGSQNQHAKQNPSQIPNMVSQPSQFNAYQMPAMNQQYAQQYGQYQNNTYFNRYYTQPASQVPKANYPQFYTQNGYRPYGHP